MRWWGAVGFSTMLGIVGCSGDGDETRSRGDADSGAPFEAGSTDDPTNEEMPPLPAPNTQRVALMVSQEGGAVTHPTGAQLSVPAGALATPVELTIQGVAAPQAAVLGTEPLGQAFVLGPEGQTFLVPVKIRVPFDATRLMPGQDIHDAQVLIAPQGSDDFVALETTVDLATSELVAETMHFSVVVPVVPSNPNPMLITSRSPLSEGRVGDVYGPVALSAKGGTEPLTWKVQSGTLPEGLSLSSAGVLSGTPKSAGTTSFTARVTDAANRRLEKAFAITIQPAPANPIAVLSGVTPATVSINSASTSVTLTGSDFVAGATVFYDGAPLSGTMVTSAHQASVTIAGELLTTPGKHAITLVNPPPGGGASNAVTFTVLDVPPNPVPEVRSVAPKSVDSGAADTQVTLYGANFMDGSLVVVGGEGGTALVTNVVSGGELTAIVSESFLAVPGTLQLFVYNPAPGGGYSVGSATLSVGSVNPVPSISWISPQSVVAGSASLQLEVHGSPFVNGAVVYLDGTALETSFQASDLLLAFIPQNLLAQARGVVITVVNPAPGGGASAPKQFMILSASDGGTGADAGASGDSGAGFDAGGDGGAASDAGLGSDGGYDAGFDGSVGLDAGPGFDAGNDAGFDAGIKLDAGVGSDAGPGFDAGYDAGYDAGFDAGPADGSVGSDASADAGMPTLITSLTPSNARVYSSDLLVSLAGAVTGRSRVTIDGGASFLPIYTRYVGRSLQFTLPGAALQSVGTVNVQLENDGVLSAPFSFEVVNTGTALPSITSLSSYGVVRAPTTVVSFTINGSNFIAGQSQVYIGSYNASFWTTVLSTTSVSVSIHQKSAVTIFDTAGTFPVRVVNPGPGGGSSNGVDFTVSGTNPAPTLDSVLPVEVGVGTPAFTLYATITNQIGGTKVRVEKDSLWQEGCTGYTMDPYNNKYSCMLSLPVEFFSSAGKITVSTTTPAPGGGVSYATVFVVDGNPTPASAAANPSAIAQGSQDTLVSITGGPFVDGTTVQEVAWGLTLSTTFVSQTELSATIPTALLSTAGTLKLRVTNPGPGGGRVPYDTSVAVKPFPSLTSASPTTIAAGSPDTLVTLYGSNLAIESFRYVEVYSGGELQDYITGPNILEVLDTYWMIKLPAILLENPRALDLRISIEGSPSTDFVTLTVQ